MEAYLEAYQYNPTDKAPARRAELRGSASARQFPGSKLDVKAMLQETEGIGLLPEPVAVTSMQIGRK